MSQHVVFLAGLPRSGSTLLANLLGSHPSIAVTPTSPLYDLVETLRRTWSDQETFLAQLDSDYNRVYERLLRSTRAFIEAWSADTDKPFVVDKNRGWLFAIETVRLLYPDFRMILCLRDLRDVYGSMERQHRKTLMLGYANRIEQNLVDVRASQLFAPTGLIGAPLRALYNLGDVGNILPHLYVWRFEEFLADPSASLVNLLTWLGIQPAEIALNRIRQVTDEADSYYRFKFPHRVAATIEAPSGFRDGDLSQRILAAIVTRFAWYYRQFYRPDGTVELATDDPSLALQGGEGHFGLG